MTEKSTVISAYIDEPATKASQMSGGHINGSFLVEAGDRYVLQCLNPDLFAGNLAATENNYMIYRRACELSEDAGKWYCPEWIAQKRGGFFYTDRDGNIWRMYRYIPSDELKKAADTGPFAAGKGLGKLHTIMEKCDGIISTEDNLRLFDLSYHYRNYRAQDASTMPREQSLDRFIDTAAEKMMDIALPRQHVIHGDAKAGNMLFEGGEVIGFVDLDTIMTGSVFDDMADCARSVCVMEDGTFDTGKLPELCRGYEEGSGKAFTERDFELLKKNVMRNRLMLGIRYYTDYLAQGNYFSDLDPKQKLEKAGSLLEEI